MILTHFLNFQESIMSLFCHWLNASHLLSLDLRRKLFFVFFSFLFFSFYTLCFQLHLLSIFIFSSFLLLNISLYGHKLDLTDLVLVYWPFKSASSKISTCHSLFRVPFHVICSKKCSLIDFCQKFNVANKLLIANLIQNYFQAKIQ